MSLYRKILAAMSLADSSGNALVTATASATSSLTGMLNTIPLAQYLATLPTLTDTYVRSLIVDIAGNLRIREYLAPQAEDNTNAVIAMVRRLVNAATYAPTVTWTTSALVATHVAKAAPGVFASFAVRIDQSAPTATYYVQLHNTAATPGAASSAFLYGPIKVVHTNGTDDFVTLDQSQYPLYGSVGVTIATSSTEYTYTSVGASYMSVMGAVVA